MQSMTCRLENMRCAGTNETIAGGNPLNSTPMILLTDADGLASNTEPAIIVLDITRKEVESGSIGSVLERLHVLTDTRENSLLYRESLVFQVSGYDDDPRELSEIPEVRSFFHRLAAEWPHWLWFLARGCSAVALLLALLCEVKRVRTNGRNAGVEYASKTELAAVMMDLFDRGNFLFNTYGIPDAAIAESADSAVNELFS